ncbi:ParA family protein [Streptomyces heilongjiangensis]|uniref:ParA family protein n=1 Tax=Streptomyces heilongjiangensis TaxID=945052 RepID=A0ABW1BHW7_9ACTN|nr:AAA family ATPase [Streptomyces heilongjiangensis]MDC2951049.1 AAA family ATPase [Streptomyces heilongjiangensis]
MNRIALPSLDGPPGDRLEIVSAWNPETPYQLWRPQILVPATFRPAAAPRTFVVVNQKGGAGKTTTAVELAAAWAAAGYRVRVIDADHQEAALSVWLLPQYPNEGPRHSLRSVFFDECSLAEATYPTLFEGIDIVPSGVDLARVEYERPIGAEQGLAAALADEAKAGTPAYDVTVIDAAPSLGLVTVAALSASDEALVPVKVGGLDMKGMASLHKTIRSVQRKTNPKLRVGSVLLTAWDKSDFARQLASKVSEDYPEAAVIPIRRSVRASEAPLAEQPVRLYAPKSTASGDYDQAARVILPGRAAA